MGEAGGVGGHWRPCGLRAQHVCLGAAAGPLERGPGSRHFPGCTHPVPGAAQLSLQGSVNTHSQVNRPPACGTCVCVGGGGPRWGPCAGAQVENT